MEWVAEAAGNCIHGTTRERPMRRFVEVERDLLRPLADTPRGRPPGVSLPFTATATSSSNIATSQALTGYCTRGSG